MSLAFSTLDSNAWTETVLRRGLAATLGSNGLRARTLIVSAAIALALHAVLAFAVSIWGFRDTGTIAVPTDAISLELIATDVVEQAAQPEAGAVPASAAAVAPVVGAAEETELASAAEAEPEALDVPEAPPPEVPAHSPDRAEVPELPAAPEPSEIATATVQQPVTVEKPKPRREESKPHPTPKAENTRSRRNAEKGGARSRGQADSRKAAGRVSASAGDISGYAARVRARVAANKPSGGGMRGTAVVSFGVSRSGGLTYARIARSSGNARLDQAALSAVRRAAPFPPPPAGASSGQLRFSSPFHFR